MVLKTRNMSSDVVKMYEVLTDLFPGIEQCIYNNLTVRDECTKRGIYSQNLIPNLSVKKYSILIFF